MENGQGRLLYLQFEMEGEKKGRIGVRLCHKQLGHVSSPRFVESGSVHRDLQRWRRCLVGLYLKEIVHKCIHRLPGSASEGCRTNETRDKLRLTLDSQILLGYKKRGFGAHL